MSFEVSASDLELVLREVQALEEENFVLADAYNVVESQSPNSKAAGDANEFTSPAAKARRKQEKQNIPTTLPLAKRSQLAQQLIEKQKVDIQKLKQKTDKLIDSIHAQLEAEEEKETFFAMERILFKQSFPEGVNRTAEQVIKYFEESLRRKDSEIDKLETKFRGLKSAVAKCENELRQKEEAGESLKRIDFDQLQIENNQLQENINARNTEVMTLKATTGRAMVQLNNAKDELAKTLQSTAELQNALTRRRQQGEKMAAEQAETEVVVKQEKAVKTMLQQRIETANNVPAVIEYVKQGQEIATLQKKIKMLQTRTASAGTTTRGTTGLGTGR